MVINAKWHCHHFIYCYEADCGREREIEIESRRDEQKHTLAHEQMQKHTMQAISDHLRRAWNSKSLRLHIFVFFHFSALSHLAFRYWHTHVHICILYGMLKHRLTITWTNWKHSEIDWAEAVNGKSAQKICGNREKKCPNELCTKWNYGSVHNTRKAN